MAGARPSSQLVEFFIAIVVGLLAILGALLCVGFLLVEPIRNPNGIGETKSLPGIYNYILPIKYIESYCFRYKYVHIFNV